MDGVEANESAAFLVVLLRLKHLLAIARCASACQQQDHDASASPASSSPRSLLSRVLALLEVQLFSEVETPACLHASFLTG